MRGPKDRLSRLRQGFIYHCVVSQPLTDFTGSILLAPSTTPAGQSVLVSILAMVGGAMPVTMAIAPLGRSSDIYWDTAHG
jgi:hypothetical protein